MPAIRSVVGTLGKWCFAQLGLDIQRLESRQNNPYQLNQIPSGQNLLQDIGIFIDTAKPYIIEVGANQGESIRAFRHVWPESKISVFEADPSLLALLQNHWSSVSGVEISEFMLLDKVSEIQVTFKGADPNHTPAITTVLSDWKKFPTLHRAVESITLDKYCYDKMVDHIDLLNIAAGGDTARVIQGAEQLLLRSAIDLVVVELNGSLTHANDMGPSAVFRQMESFRYNCVGIYNQFRDQTGLRTADSLWRPTLRPGID